MLAYKFRGSNQIALALDIVFNNRLYCAEWGKLNDPMEGAFGYSYDSTEERDFSKEVADIIRRTKQIKVCSLSKTFDRHLLWAHYASGFEGLAVEVELPDNSPEVKTVEYGGVFAHLPIQGHIDAGLAAEQVLCSKYSEWKYEQEVRILHADQWYRLQNPVKRIIAGHRMNPALFEALRIICDHKGIMLNRTGIGDEGIDADFVPPLSEEEKKKKRLGTRG